MERLFGMKEVPRSDEGGAMTVFDDGIHHVRLGMVNYGSKSIVADNMSWSAGLDSCVRQARELQLVREKCYRAVVRDRCKGHNDGFQKETELFGGEEYDPM